MIKEVTSIEDANICDELLTKLILDERKYNEAISENTIVKDYFSKTLNDENSKLLAYYLNDEIVGYILIKRTEPNIGLLDGLYVLEEHRHKKIAKELLSKALEECKKLNIKYVDINIMKDNKIALQLYKEMGFNDFEIKLRKSLNNYK